MAITKQKKTEIANKLTDILSKAESVVFVKFDKLTVGQVNSLRRKLQGEGIGYTVAKKTLIKRAIDERKLEGEVPPLDGEIAIAYGSDPLATSREVFSFQKENKENISIVGGIFEGKLTDQKTMLSIATIPSRQVLYGQFVNLINSPLQGLVIGLNAIAEKKA